MLGTEENVLRHAAGRPPAPLSTMVESGATEQRPGGSKPRPPLLRKSSVTSAVSAVKMHKGRAEMPALLPMTRLEMAGAPLKTPTGSPALVRPLPSMLRLLSADRLAKSAGGISERKLAERMSVTSDLSGENTPAGRPSPVSWQEARERYTSAPWLAKTSAGSASSRGLLDRSRLVSAGNRAKVAAESMLVATPALLSTMDVTPAQQPAQLTVAPTAQHDDVTLHAADGTIDTLTDGDDDGETGVPVTDGVSDGVSVVDGDAAGDGGLRVADSESDGDTVVDSRLAEREGETVADDARLAEREGETVVDARLAESEGETVVDARLAESERVSEADAERERVSEADADVVCESQRNGKSMSRSRKKSPRMVAVWRRLRRRAQPSCQSQPPCAQPIVVASRGAERRMRGKYWVLL